MSKAKFAPLTAGLLARKGEAQPAAPASAPAASAPAASAPAQPRIAQPRIAQPRIALVAGFARTPPSVNASAAPAARALFTAEPPSPTRRDCLEAVPGADGARPTEDGAQKAHHTVAVRVQGLGAMGLRRRTAVTVRLDEARYLRLKLTGARLHRTNQDLLVAALDSYLTQLGIEGIEPAR